MVPIESVLLYYIMYPPEFLTSTLPYNNPSEVWCCVCLVAQRCGPSHACLDRNKVGTTCFIISTPLSETFNQFDVYLHILISAHAAFAMFLSEESQNGTTWCVFFVSCAYTSGTAPTSPWPFWKVDSQLASFSQLFGRDGLVGVGEAWALFGKLARHRSHR